MTAPLLSDDSVTGFATALPTGRNAEDVVDNAASPQTAISLYRKYRPQSFESDELVGQDHVIRTLRNALSLGRVAHAYLFCGPRGTGKTTTARIVAKAVNCLHDDPQARPCNVCANCNAINANATPDVIEIDAASNRGIDDIRDLRDRVRYAPTMLPSKVYIIDEAHQITGAAANAFLKTLEEPPSHSRFILATTDPEELLPTIVSRCQRFDFRRVSVADLTRRLRTVSNREGIGIAEDALQVIARQATGSVRDAIGLLDQVALQCADDSVDGQQVEIGAPAVRAALGLSRNDRLEAIVEAVAQRNAGKALSVVQDAVDAGEDPRQINRQLVSYLRLLLLERSGATTDADDQAKALASSFQLNDLAGLARRFNDIDFSIKHSPYPQLPLEIALVESTASPAEPTLADMAPYRPGPEEKIESSPRPSSLRERVRAGSSSRGAVSESVERSSVSAPAPVTPIRRDSLPTSQPAAASTGDLGVDVAQIAELWPQVRADVKALNRRIEALLSEVDPVAISGKQITLAVPYPFHRDKLNTDEVRDTVTGAISRLLGKDVSLLCVLRSELSQSTSGSSTTAPVSSPSPVHEDAVPEDQDEEERARVRLNAAINIFDAEEINDLDLTGFPLVGDA
jgi:DNA polymerase-3 subunit gamma/tau